MLRGQRIKTRSLGLTWSSASSELEQGPKWCLSCIFFVLYCTNYCMLWIFCCSWPSSSKDLAAMNASGCFIRRVPRGWHVPPLFLLGQLLDDGNSVCYKCVKTSLHVCNILKDQHAVRPKVDSSDWYMHITILWFVCIAKTAAHNSRQGIVSFLSGANLAQPMKEQWCRPSWSVILR